jgi:monofunctional glycosyltransferase
MLKLFRLLLVLVLAPLAASVLVVVALRWMPPPTTSFMMQSPVKPVRYQWVGKERIAEPMRKAVVASEDQKFFAHRGFDLEAIDKARKNNLKGRKIRGGSTISQQTAKNLFLWSGGGYVRKGIEAYFTILIETLWPKQRVLEVYLNVAEFGPGIYGVEAAARAFFGKSAQELSAAEASRLAAVLPSPRRWRAGNPGPYVQKRSAWILGQIGYGVRVPTDEEPEAIAEEQADDAAMESPPVEGEAAPAEAPAATATEEPPVIEEETVPSETAEEAPAS